MTKTQIKGGGPAWTLEDEQKAGTKYGTSNCLRWSLINAAFSLGPTFFRHNHIKQKPAFLHFAFTQLWHVQVWQVYHQIQHLDKSLRIFILEWSLRSYAWKALWRLAEGMRCNASGTVSWGGRMERFPAGLWQHQVIIVPLLLLQKLRLKGCSAFIFHSSSMFRSNQSTTQFNLCNWRRTEKLLFGDEGRGHMQRRLRQSRRRAGGTMWSRWSLSMATWEDFLPAGEMLGSKNTTDQR